MRPCIVCGSIPCICSPTMPHVPLQYVTQPDPTGWTCPKCSRVWAPHVDECRACNPTPSAIATTAPEGKR